MKKLLLFLIFGAYFLGINAQSIADSWNLWGNVGTTTRNFLGTTDYKPLIFKTNNTEYIRLLPNGNIGIGTDQPQEKLNVVDGNVLITKNLIKTPIPPNGSLLFGTDVNSIVPHLKWGIEYLYFNSCGYGLTFYRPNLIPCVLFLSDNGNIGIGTSNVQAKLDVEGTFKAQSAKIKGKNQNNGFNMSYTNANFSLKQQEQGKFFIEGPGGGLMIAPDGNIGVGTDIPKQKLHVVDGNILISKTSAKNMDASAPGSPNGSILFGANIGNNINMGKWGIEYLNGEDNSYGLNVWRPWNPGGTWSNYNLFLADDGNIGINKKDPKAKLDINGTLNTNGRVTFKEGSFNLALGNAYSSNLNFGTSYIGFNAVRDNGNWTLTGDGANNGGGVIWSSIWGDIYFASIPKSSSNSGGAQTLTDTQLKEHVKLQLTAAGVLKAKEVQVTLAGWPDFVFDKDYKLPTLSEVAQFITENQHLPNVPSAAEVEANGLNLGEMNAILVLKVEELTLYILDLQKQINELKTNKP
jgi:hypothetical protein